MLWVAGWIRHWWVNWATKKCESVHAYLCPCGEGEFE